VCAESGHRTYEKGVSLEVFSTRTEKIGNRQEALLRPDDDLAWRQAIRRSERPERRAGIRQSRNA